MIVKSYEVQKNLSNLLKYNFFLLYGENVGLKKDIIESIKISSKKNDDSIEILSFYENEILENEENLYNSIYSGSLFGSKKIVNIYEASDKIFKKISDICDKDPANTCLIISSNILDKKSKLRNYFEKDKKNAVIACYQDDERRLTSYINLKLKGYNGLSPEVINLIIGNSNLDRRVIKNEISKIKLCFKDKIIKKDQLEELLNIKSDTTFDKIRDACLLGDSKKVNKLLGELDFQSESFVFYLYSLNNRAMKLLEIINTNEQTKDVDIALETIKPKIFWKDKPIYLQQIKKWNQDNLQHILNKISETELLIKKHSQIKTDTLIKSLLVDICVKASSS